MRRLLHALFRWAAHRRDAMVTAALDEPLPEPPRAWDHELAALLDELSD